MKGELLKKVIEALKDLVSEANFDVSSTGISLQAMDSSHVSLCALSLRSDGFDLFRCDRSMPLGINLQSMSKVLKCCNKDDIVTLKAEDDGDTISFMFESQAQDRISDFELKLMDIDSEHLGIPDTEYKATVIMPAGEFTRICNDLSILGETVGISVGKDGVKFTVTGEMVRARARLCWITRSARAPLADVRLLPRPRRRAGHGQHDRARQRLGGREGRGARRDRDGRAGQPQLRAALP